MRIVSQRRKRLRTTSPIATTSRSLGWRLLAVVLVTILSVPRTAARSYALYNLPGEIEVQFETRATDLPALSSGGLLSETNGHNSALSFPLRQASQTFLRQELQQKIGRLETQANAQDPNQQFPWFAIYAHLVGVDLSVIMYAERGSSASTSEEATTLVRANIVGSLAFEEPADASTKPSNEQVSIMLKQWMGEILSSSQTQFWSAIQQESSLALYQQASQVQMKLVEASSSRNNNAPITTTSPEKSSSTLLTLVILLSLLSVGYLGFATIRKRKRRRQQQRELTLEGGYSDDDDDDGYNFSGRIREGDTKLDAKRHGSFVETDSTRLDAMELLQKLEELPTSPREYTAPSNPLEALYSAFSSWTSTQPPAQPFLTSPQGAFTPSSRSRRSSVLEDQADNLAAAAVSEEDEEDEIEHGEAVNGIRQEFFQDELEDEEYYVQHQQSSIGGSIWRNLTHFWEGSAGRRHDDHAAHYENNHPAYYDEHGMPVPGDLELQTVSFSSDHMVLEDEDPADYDFAFQDFPRHDGTPCLIFNDDGTMLTPKQRQIFEIGSPEKDAGPVLNQGTTPVSNDAFARMLAEQGSNPTGTSPDASLLLESPLLADDATTKTEDEGTVSSSNLPPEFKDALSRLYEQKHRQYEKKSIVEKHQERRAKERKSQREQERRERHLMMEGTIEDLEVATGTTPRWAAATKSGFSTSSPKPYRHQRHPSYGQSPKTKYSPKPSYSPYRSSAHHSDNISRASPSLRALDWDSSTNNPSMSTRSWGASSGMQTASVGSQASERFRMRPMTTAQPTNSITSDDFWAPPSSSGDLSMPPMMPSADAPSTKTSSNGSSSTNKFSSPNDVFLQDAPTSISLRRKTSIENPLRRKASIENPMGIYQRVHGDRGISASSIGSNGTVGDPRSAMHRRVNSFDPKAVVGYERPVPQQRRKPRGHGRPGTPNRTRSRTPTRALTPVRKALTPVRHPPQQRRSRGASIDESLGTEDSNRSLGSGAGSRHQRAASHSQSGDVFTHGIVAQTRFI